MTYFFSARTSVDPRDEIYALQSVHADEMLLNSQSVH